MRYQIGHFEMPQTMKLVCYLFDISALENLATQVSRVNKVLPIGHIAVVYREGLPVEAISRRFSLSDINVKSDFYAYQGKQWEFGAYQYGIDRIVRDGDELIVLNDTVGKHYPLFQEDLRRFAQQVELARATTLPSIVGKVESIKIPFQLNGCDFDRWIRSNFYYLNEAALDSIGRRVLVDSVFGAPQVNGALFSLGLPASKSLEDYLAGWMSPHPGKRGWAAHTGRTNIPDAVRRDKTGSILSEKFLSARILQAGGQLLNLAPDRPSALYRAKVRWFSRLRKYASKISRSLRRRSLA